MPYLEIVDLEAGHGMNMESAEPFDDAVIAFLTAHATDADAGPEAQPGR
jgi:hypothetical protein